MLVISMYSSIGNIAQGSLDQFINPNAFGFGGINEMTIIVTYEAGCDFCGNVFSISRVHTVRFPITKKRFIKELRIAGWTTGKYVTCSECRSKKQKP